MPVGERVLAYDPRENILSLSFKGVHLKTPEEIDAHFDACIQYWRAQTDGKKVYWLVCFDDFSVDLKYSEKYAAQMQRILQTALGIARYGGVTLAHAAVDLYSLRLKTSSNFHRSRDEALVALRKMRVKNPAG